MKLIKKYKGFSVVVLIVVLGISILGMIFSAVSKKRTAAEAEAYRVAKEDTIQKMKEEAYTEAYEKAERAVHVKNQAVISVDSLREKAELVVLDVYDVEYVIAEPESNEEGILSWLRVPGKGAYTVDLNAAEYIVDNEHQSVLVRVPEPRLENCSIVYEEVERLLFKNKGFNESDSVGANKAREQLLDGYMLIQRNLGSDVSFYQLAEASAERMIISLVNAVNPEVENLQVEVEFIY